MLSLTLHPIMVLSVVTCGLVAGIFYAFSTFVMPALGGLDAEKGISSMQAINITVITPLFFVAFFGAALCSVYLGFYAYVQWGSTRAIYLMVGSGLYLVGSLLVTMVFNVPLNNTLAVVTANPMTDADVMIWSEYLLDWTFWNHVRTMASLGAMVAFIFALKA